MKRPTITTIGLGTALCGLAVGTAWALTLVSQEYQGVHTQTRAGYALAVGDVQGDPNPELIVGAPAFEGGDDAGVNTDSSMPSGWSGQVIVYPGTAGGPNPAPLFVLHGENPNDRFGTAVKVADVVGPSGTPDGIPDVIVSALFASPHDAYHTGCVYIFQGPLATDTPPHIHAHMATAKVCGTQYRQQFGRTLATGDFDGDGLTDIAVGSPWHSEAHSHAVAGHPSDGYLTGATYLITAAAITDFQNGVTPEIDAPFSHGDGWTAAYGESLLAMGDIDTTDARHELLIFAPGAENHGHSGNGRAYLATWSDTPLPDGDPTGFEDPLVVVRGTGGLGAGRPDFIGDIDGDGIQEIGMASGTGSGTPSGVDTDSAGGLYVVRGDLLNFTRYAPATLNPDGTVAVPEAVNKLGDVSLAAITGERAQDKFGNSMVGLGDLNGDGVADFAVGAPWADGLITTPIELRSVISGTVYLINGKTVKEKAAASDPNRMKFKIRGSGSSIAAPLLTEIPGAGNDRFGESLMAGYLLPSASTVLNLIIGAPDHDPTSTNTLDDIPGTNSNDNRGSVFVESFGQ